jgi:hypothetical protein
MTAAGMQRMNGENAERESRERSRGRGNAPGTNVGTEQKIPSTNQIERRQDRK